VRSKADKKQLSLADGTETKNLGKTKNKKRCRQRSVKAVQEEEVELGGVGFVKQVGFKPRVKERGRYG